MRYFLWNVPVDIVGISEAIEKIKVSSEQNIFRQVVTLNLEMLTLAQFDKELLKIIQDSYLVVPDGKWITYLLRIFKKVKADTIPGIELTEEIFKKYPNIRTYLLGSKHKTVEHAAEMLIQKYGFTCVGFSSGYFMDNQKIIKNICNSKANLLIVGLGTPKQEKWINSHKSKLPLVAVGVGGSIDVWSGESKRAPKFFKNFGLEWLYRVYREPKRSIRLLNTVFRLFIIFITRGRP